MSKIELTTEQVLKAQIIAQVYPRGMCDGLTFCTLNPAALAMAAELADAIIDEARK